MWWHMLMKPAVLVIGASVLINGGTWLATWLLFPDRDSALVLHYTVNVGIDFVGQGQHITVLPLTGSLLLLMNIVVGLAAYAADTRVSWVMWAVLPLLQAIVAGAVFLIWQINF